MKKVLIILLLTGAFLVSGCTELIPINTEDELSQFECGSKGGHLASVQNDGTACKFSEIDIGKVNDVRCICQCCKPK